MSRIHEALKRAEQERAATQGGAAPPPYEGTAVAEAPVYAPEAMSGTGSVSAAVHTMQPLASPFNLDALLAHTPAMQWKPDPAVMLFTNGDDSGRGTEEYRTLRSRLYHVREKMPLRKLLITSALPKEGKSFTAMNLAQVLVRQPGRRVLLVDADLRGPQLHRMLGTGENPGLSDYLLGQTDEYSIMQRGPLENLFFIPSGCRCENPAELVGNGRLKFLLQRIESAFDWIIVDSPPAVPVSDSSMLAKACDGVLMVVRSNSTPLDMARKARQEFPDESLIGVVLNGTREDAAPYERYYYEVYEKNGTGKRA